MCACVRACMHECGVCVCVCVHVCVPGVAARDRKTTALQWETSCETVQRSPNSDKKKTDDLHTYTGINHLPMTLLYEATRTYRSEIWVLEIK